MAPPIRRSSWPPTYVRLKAVRQRLTFFHGKIVMTTVPSPQQMDASRIPPNLFAWVGGSAAGKDRFSLSRNGGTTDSLIQHVGGRPSMAPPIRRSSWPPTYVRLKAVRQRLTFFHGKIVMTTVPSPQQMDASRIPMDT